MLAAGLFSAKKTCVVVSFVNNFADFLLRGVI
jgi:hypothetical protein